MLKKYIGVILTVLGALILLSSVVVFEDYENNRVIRYSGGLMFLIGSLIISTKSQSGSDLTK
ncbi:hypothetical protein [Bacillus suaedae]|uniref:Uncharacterized protein n=1 Tax=Halalkalibacter suaedae TaxID=2822140 RepID=A0A940WSQ5_9BACI|nr:hypothetical protein [Bacillus suaedae]MBP3951586.1 hypothetical protein [Bacillus suaedae]